jgi:hypothetical protein
LVRSTLKAALFSGIFTAVPLEGVRVMVLTSTVKERRLVLGGGVRGAAVMVTLSVAVPPPQLDVQVEVLGKPLHEMKPTAARKMGKERILRTSMNPPGQSGCHVQPRRRQWLSSITLSLVWRG